MKRYGFDFKVNDELFVIWSFEHSAWWAKGGYGYVVDLKDAGVFDYETARKICKGANSYRKINECMIPFEEDAWKDAMPELAR